MLVIGHRGACGYRPEHTLASYGLAVELGADYVEPDLVATRDGVLVARHEHEISATTDVAEHRELAHLRTTKTVAGQAVSGWFTEDLTYAELRTLRCRERLPALRPASALFDDRFRVPTLDEVLDLAVRAGARRGRPVGVYPELKHPSYFRSRGLPVEDLLIEGLRRFGLDDAEAPVFVQSFEPGALRRLSFRTRVPLVQLVPVGGAPHDAASTGDHRTYAELTRPDGLRDLAGVVTAVGVDKRLVLPRTEDGRLGERTALVDDAHAAGLLVHAWTFRSENTFLPTPMRDGDDPGGLGRDTAEYAAFAAAGVDGVFTDHPDAARLAVDLVPSLAS